jgi:hypothetical protein
VEPLPTNMRPRSLVISRSNAFIAIGYYSFVHLYSFQQTTKVWDAHIPIPDFGLEEQMRFQVLSFSADSRYLTVATQRFDKQKGKDDNSVTVRVWRCEQFPGEGTLMGYCFMPTDHIGLTSTHFDPMANKTFVGGFIDTPYPLFHSASPESLRSLHGTRSGAIASSSHNTSSSQPSSFKMRCSSQSPSNTYVSFITASDKVYRVNLKTQAVELLCDLSGQRGRLQPNEEAAVLGMPTDDRVYVVWKEGAKLYLVEVTDDGRVREKIDIRWLADASGWGEGS